MKLNRNNFLRWEGQFKEAPFQAIANNDAVNISSNQETVQFNPLINDVATYGINLSTLRITVFDNPTNPATWDSATSKITYYLAEGSLPGTNKVLKYKWLDFNGNQSNEATVNISVTARPTAWRGLSSSYSCVVDPGSGDRTGYGKFATLEQYYTDGQLPFLSGIQKPNSSSDPNYIAPVLDSSCTNESYLTYNLKKSGTVPGSCIIGSTQPYYTDNTNIFLYVGCSLFTDTALTIPILEGYYGDNAGLSYHVVSGYIVDIISCSDHPTEEL